MDIDIINNYYLKEDGTFDKESAMKLCAMFAGVCYDKEGFDHIQNENEEKTLRRMNLTLNNGHHSVYDHIFITLNIKNIPKIIAMFLNNEKEYTTSEKSLRYTKISSDNPLITQKEEELYNKWVNIFNEIISENYKDKLSNLKIKKLSYENARYLTSVFVPTQMIYTTSLRQLNYISSWMKEYIKNSNSDFEKKVSVYMKEFIDKLSEKNILDERLMMNEKSRKLSLITDEMNNDDYFSNIYNTTYKGSYAELAQAQRHRTIDYKYKDLPDFEYFTPLILNNYLDLISEWNNDMNLVKDVHPQGQLVLINETGKYEDFLLKCKERLCSASQLEIMLQTKETLEKYKEYLKNTKNPLYNDIIKYSHGARCTFPDYKCYSDCKFIEGKTLKRKV